MGHRNQIGLAFHPDTGELWATEHGVQGGDEANIIPARLELRLAHRLLQPDLWRPADHRDAVAARVHRTARDVVAVDRPVGPHLLRWGALPRLARQPLRRLDDGGPDAAHRPPRASRLQPAGTGDPPRVAADGAEAAGARRPAGTRRLPVRPDRRGQRGAAAHRAGPRDNRGARQHRAGGAIDRRAGAAAAGSGMDRRSARECRAARSRGPFRQRGAHAGPGARPGRSRPAVHQLHRQRVDAVAAPPRHPHPAHRVAHPERQHLGGRGEPRGRGGPDRG